MLREIPPTGVDGAHSQSLMPQSQMAEFESGLSVFTRSDAGPIVRTERRSGQSRLIIKITYGIVGPRVANCCRTRYVFTPNDDGVTFNAGFGPNEFVIRPRNCEAFWWSTIGGFQSATGLREPNAKLGVFD